MRTDKRLYFRSRLEIVLLGDLGFEGEVEVGNFFGVAGARGFEESVAEAKVAVRVFFSAPRRLCGIHAVEVVLSTI
jgi:hypothetical protein